MSAITEANAAVSNTPSAPFALTAATFAEHVQQPGILVIDFWAQWCGPCRAFAPVFEGAAKRHVDVRWAKVDTDAEPDLSEALAIRSIPTLMIFRDGILVFTQPGMVGASALDALVEKIRALDMDKVKASARPVRSR